MRLLPALALTGATLSLTGLPAIASADPATAPEACVVLLHGLARSEDSMWMLQEVLQYHGYLVVNDGYPSEQAPVMDLVRHVGEAAARCPADRPLDFVTHSLGGILVRAWLATHHPANLHRVVMLAPPNHGSEIVDTLASNDLSRPLMTWFDGPATSELGTGPGSVPNQLPPSVDFELGVVAGDVPINPLAPIAMSGPNDGTVSVASTRIDGMADHIVINATHTLIMMNPIAMAEVLEFLRNGVFDHGITLPGALRKLALR